MVTKKTKDNNDLQLFKEQMQDVKPIKNDRVSHKTKVNTRPIKKSPDYSTTDNERRFSTEHVPDCEVILRFERPGIQKPVLKKLRQGKMPIEADLDLHGYTAEHARSEMIKFMDQCQREQIRVACIVHGKGFGSSEKKPVIKPLVNKWLREDSNVLAFSSAQPKDGGTGAIYVLLRKSEN